jgi:hypothetical protein
MPLPTPEETRDEDTPVVEVVLADGRAWGLALPRIRLSPVTCREADSFGRPRTRVELETLRDYPLEVWRLWDAVRAASKDDEAGMLEAVRSLASAILRMAHDVESDEAEALLDSQRVDLFRIAAEFIPAAFGDANLLRTDGR